MKFSTLPSLELPQTRPSRVVIDRVSPQIENGRFAAKRFLNDQVEIRVFVFGDGHDMVKGRVHLRHESESKTRTLPLLPQGNDEWTVSFTAEKLGLYFYEVEAAADRFGNWRSDTLKKLTAQQAIQNEILMGVQLLEPWLQHVGAAEQKILQSTLQSLRQFSKTEKPPVLADFQSLLQDPALTEIAHRIFDQDSVVRTSVETPIRIEPDVARFSAWYEFFPRSTVKSAGAVAGAKVHGTGQSVHGTFKMAEERLKYVSKLGFNVVYLPPIHPIGKAFRKGKNNTLDAKTDDVGSPWAIGGAAGGHREILPELGSMADFESLVKKARSMKIELAMDIAFQCSPDHPYVKEHPQWFKKRPDGTIQYAENPPKKYQDIYPFDFECEDWQALWTELRDVVLFWITKGVRVFRVDNPHTKPFHFWEWLIASVRAKHPDVIFLAEAFTRPKIMGYLGKAGFSQSYTYFTWRNVKWELTQYMNELTQTEWSDFYNPNFWPNTPDILPEALQAPNRGHYMQRFVLAATLSSNYGIYGPAFELMEHEPMKKGGEEYLNSEKYELRQWNLEKKESLASFIQRINEIRKSEKPLQHNRSLKFHPVANEQLIAYSKCDGDERVLVIVNLDPHNVQSGMVELPLLDWKIDPEKDFEVHDLLSDSKYYWRGWRNYVQLSPEAPAHIFRVRKGSDDHK